MVYLMNAYKISNSGKRTNHLLKMMINRPYTKEMSYNKWELTLVILFCIIDKIWVRICTLTVVNCRISKEVSLWPKNSVIWIWFTRNRSKLMSSVNARQTTNLVSAIPENSSIGTSKMSKRNLYLWCITIDTGKKYSEEQTLMTLIILGSLIIKRTWL